MGLSAKIWPISDADIAQCTTEMTTNVVALLPVGEKHITTLFHRVSDDDCARVWGARRYHAALERLLDRNIGLVKLDDSDPTYALDSAALRKLLERRGADELILALVEPELPEVGGEQSGSIVDLTVRAVNAGLGIAFCIFEDW